MKRKRKYYGLYNEKKPLVDFATKKPTNEFFWYKIHGLFELVSPEEGLNKDPRTA